MTTENTVYRAWLNARENRQIVDGFIFHSDRGVQYASDKMSLLFRENTKIQQSMSRKGNCWDNAVAESFFRSIKCEMIYHYNFTSFQQTYNEIQQYIEWYNNTKRIHQSLGYLTPLEMEGILRRKNTTKRAA